MASVKQIFSEVKTEFKKVKWPGKDESINSIEELCCLSNKAFFLLCA
mgnify:CR=1 FL=1